MQSGYRRWAYCVRREIVYGDQLVGLIDFCSHTAHKRHTHTHTYNMAMAHAIYDVECWDVRLGRRWSSIWANDMAIWSTHRLLAMMSAEPPRINLIYSTSINPLSAGHTATHKTHAHALESRINLDQYNFITYLCLSVCVVILYVQAKHYLMTTLLKYAGRIYELRWERLSDIGPANANKTSAKWILRFADAVDKFCAKPFINVCKFNNDFHTWNMSWNFSSIVPSINLLRTRHALGTSEHLVKSAEKPKSNLFGPNQFISWETDFSYCFMDDWGQRVKETREFVKILDKLCQLILLCVHFESKCVNNFAKWQSRQQTQISNVLSFTYILYTIHGCGTMLDVSGMRMWWKGYATSNRLHVLKIQLHWWRFNTHIIIFGRRWWYLLMRGFFHQRKISNAIEIMLSECTHCQPFVGYLCQSWLFNVMDVNIKFILLCEN